MATIVNHRPTGVNYILLGTGYGAYESVHPKYCGDLFPSAEMGAFSLVAVSDAHGRIFWLNSGELLVLSVDGKRPSELL